MTFDVYVYTGNIYVDDQEIDHVPSGIQHVIVAPHLPMITSESFQNCTLLVSVSLPLGLKVIGERAFEKCTSLTTVSIPPSVNAILCAAFQQCKGLESMDLPEGLTEIADKTFAHCESLRHVHISSTVLTIGTTAFAGCHRLPHVDFPAGLCKIREAAFALCEALERILIPPTVAEIGERAFMWCSTLRSVEISISEGERTNGGLQLIERAAFAFCYALVNIAIPNHCIVASDVFLDCHEMFADGLQPDQLKTRFDDLSYHKICYQQGHGALPPDFTSTVQDEEICSERAYDMFGLTPLHILALSARLNVIALRRLLNGKDASKEGILAFDMCIPRYEHRATPLGYAIENHTPGALAFIKVMLHALIDKRTTYLGFELWQSDILRAVNSFEGRDTKERIARVHELFSMLRLYERKEAIALLDQAVWKQRMETEGGNEGDRQGSYLNSGAGTVIQNVLPYLGRIVKGLSF